MGIRNFAARIAQHADQRVAKEQDFQRKDQALAPGAKRDQVSAGIESLARFTGGAARAVAGRTSAPRSAFSPPPQASRPASPMAAAHGPNDQLPVGVNISHQPWLYSSDPRLSLRTNGHQAFAQITETGPSATHEPTTRPLRPDDLHLGPPPAGPRES